MKYSEEVINELVKNINILDYISKFIDLKQHGKDWFGVCPFHKETDASFSVSPEKNIYYCFGCGNGGTIINFIMNYHKYYFNKTIEYLIKELNLDISKVKLESNTLKLLRTFTKNTIKKDIKREILNEEIFNKFRKAEIKEWMNEGIANHVLDYYKVMYDDRSKRIVYPIYTNDGVLINIKGRTLLNNFKELGVSKYIYYYPLGTLDFVCGIKDKIQQIKDCNEIILFEGIKSVMKLDTWDIKNSVSIETNRITDYQIKFILSLNSNITIAMDKGIDINQIKKDFKMLIRYGNVALIYDNKNLLKDKDAPCDRGIEIWNELYKNKIKLS